MQNELHVLSKGSFDDACQPELRPFLLLMSLACIHRRCIIIGPWPWSWLGVLRDDLPERWGKTPRGVLPYISHVGMYLPKAYGASFGPFWFENRV